MSDDTDVKMYEIKAGLEEIKEEMKRIKKENTDLKNNMAFNNLMEKVDDFQRNNSNRFEAIEENLRMLTTTISSNHSTFAEIKETLKNLKEAIQLQKENEKCLVDDHARLFETVGAMQVNFNTLFTKVSNNEQILSEINENLRKQNDTLEKQNKNVLVLKKDMKAMKEETILLLGGWNGFKKVDSLLILQKNDENWKELNIKLPYAVWCHGAQLLNNNLYIFGGANENKETLNSTYKLSIRYKWYTLSNGFQWDKMADMNEKRTHISNSSVILNDRIWVLGGFNGKEVVKSVEMYDPQTNIWTNMKEMNECRSLAAAAVVHEKIFCCGGETEQNCLKTTECYDSSSDVWTLISDMPGPNISCGAVEMNGHLIVIGGRATKGKDVLSSVWVLNTTDKNAKWIEKETHMSLARCQFSIAKIDDKIFVCGGTYIDQKDSKLHSGIDVEIFDGEIWRKGPKMPTFLQNAAAVVIPMEFARSLN